MALHTHVPPSHSWPGRQGPVVPHMQVLFVQRSADGVRQETHTAPLVPQVALVFEVHTPLKQHPLGQVLALQPEQVPLWHC